MTLSEAYSEPSQTSRMECFAKIVKSLTIFAKHFILTGSEYASVW